RARDAGRRQAHARAVSRDGWIGGHGEPIVLGQLYRPVALAEVDPDDQALAREPDSACILVDLYVHASGRREAAAQGDQGAVPIDHVAVSLLAQLLPPELRSLERRRVLRIGDQLRPPAESRELAAPSLGDRPPKLGIGVVG